MNQFHVADEGRVRAALRAVLHDAAVLLRRGHKLTTFVNTVRQRLLDIDVLARLASPHRGERVPVVRCGDGNRVNLLVLQGLADVLVESGRFALGGLDIFSAAFEHLRIHVAQRDVLGFILHSEDILDVASALAVEADGAHADAIVCAEHFAGGHRARHDHGGGCLSDKLSASELHIEFLVVRATGAVVV